MKKKRFFAALTAAAMLFSGMQMPLHTNAAETVVFSGITGLPFAGGEPFKGVDVSSVISLEESGIRFYDGSGKEQDLFRTLADAGVNTVRIRIWNDPTGSQNHQTYGGGANDTACAVKIAERCAAAGLKLFVDFHYSDFWADPAKQRAPKAWEQYSVSQKADAIYHFTAETLQKLKATGADIAMVQIGNETTTGMCGVSLDSGNWGDGIWRDLASLWNAGAKAVREFDKNTLVALHFTNPEKASNMAYLAKMLKQTNVDYDVFATSYYPYWHGTLQNLTSVLSDIARTYSKKVLVAETSWAYNFEDTDQHGNTIGSADKLGSYVSYPVSAAGQTAFLQDLFRAVAAVPNGMGIGVFYWEPAWLGIPDAGQRNELWNRYGSGWATQTAMEYDADAKYYGGSAVENQALFDAQGKPLDSLYVFRTIHGGGGSQPKSDKNLLKNPDFEADGGWSAEPAGWKLHATADDHFDVRAEDARSGGYALHWYSEGAFSESTAEASVTAPESGSYRCALMIQGSENSRFTLTVSAGGKTEQVTGTGSGWSVWQETAAAVFAQAGETITLKLTVSGDAGAYGSVDDCSIVKVQEQPAETTTLTTTVTTTETTTTTTTESTAAETTTESAAETTTSTIETTETTSGSTETSAETPAYLRGDATRDNVVDVADAVLLARLNAEDPEAVISTDGLRCGDYNSDGEINAEDVLMILRHIARLE